MMMKSVKDNMQYDYIKSIDYNKFGAKYLVVYGNDVEMFYRYNKVNLRLEMQSLFTRKQQLPTGNRFYLDVNYGYDRKGNITNISTIHYDHPEFSSEQTFRYDDADQLITASGNNDTSSLYNMSMSYGNYGRINTGNVAFTDPQDPQAVQQQYSNSYQYTSLNNTFAPSSANNGDITFTFGINGSMRKRTDNVQNKTEYYLFNAFDNMKAYSDNGEKYGYYGYDDKGERVYKIQLTNTDIHTNRLGGKTLNVESIMFYPSGYMNLDQYGNYTKHYYADDQRIASKIGSGYGEKHGDGYIFYSIGGGGSSNFISVYDCIKNELGEVTHDTIDNIVCPFDMPNYLIGDSGRYENALFFYHGDHLSSTAIVTDIDANVTKAALYLPFGTPLSIYNSHWELDTVLPKYLFQSAEYDEENKSYLMGLRYLSYEDMIFRSRDLKFEKYFWQSSYCAFANNPLRYADPTGMDWVEREVDGVKETYYDRKVKSQADVDKKYGENSGVRHLADGSKVGDGKYTVYNDHENNRNGVVKDANGNVVNNDRTIIYGKDFTIFAGVTDKSVNAETLHKNLFGTSYTGGNNPRDYGGDWNYDYIPRNLSELASIGHDKAYGLLDGWAGIKSFQTTGADFRFSAESFALATSANPSTKDRARAAAQGVTGIGFGVVGVVNEGLNKLKEFDAWLGRPRK